MNRHIFAVISLPLIFYLAGPSWKPSQLMTVVKKNEASPAVKMQLLHLPPGGVRP